MHGLRNVSKCLSHCMGLYGCLGVSLNYQLHAYCSKVATIIVIIMSFHRYRCTGVSMEL